MLSIYAGDALVASMGSNDQTRAVTSPSLAMEVGKAGSLKFSIYPTHPLYESMQKLVTIVTVRDGEDILFRGRVYSIERKITGERQVYCEGDLSFLLDSLMLSGTFQESVRTFFTRCVESHNAQVDVFKRFTVGNIAVSWADEIVDVNLTDDSSTKDVLDSELLSKYGGYIQTRHEAGGMIYLDYVEDFTQEAGQTLEFGENILDFTDSDSADDIFTVLRPIGKDGLTVADANGGSAYIENAELITRYGRIYKKVGFSEATDAATLLANGNTYFQRQIVKWLHSMTIKAVDLHLLNVALDRLGCGKVYRILCKPHGIDWRLVCVKMDGVFDPANTTYQLGVPQDTLSEKTSSTAKTVATQQKTIVQQSKSIEQNKQDIVVNKNSIKVNANDIAVNAKNIEVNASNLKLTATAVTDLSNNLDDLGQRTSNLSIEMDAVNGKLALKADSTVVDELGKHVNEVAVELDNVNATLTLKAEKSEVDGFAERLSSAEIAIDGANANIALKVSKNKVISAINVSPEEILLKAEKINLSGYVTATQLDAVSVEMANLRTGKAKADIISSALIQTAAITIGGFKAHWQSIKGGDNKDHWYLVHN